MKKLTQYEQILFSTDPDIVLMKNTAPEKLPLKPRASWFFQLRVKGGKCKQPRTKRPIE